MKKLLLIAFVFAATTIAAKAQTKKTMTTVKKTNAEPVQNMSMAMGSPTEKGTWLLGGSAGFESTDGETAWVLAPDLGYFIKDNLAIGARAAIGDEGFGTVWAFTAFAKPYFGKSDMGKFFVEPNIGVAGASEVDTELTYGGRAGYALFLNRSIGLEFGAGYRKIGDFPGTIGLNIGFQIHFKK